MPAQYSPQQILQAASFVDPELAETLRRFFQPPALPDPPEKPEPCEVPALPETACLPDELAASACPWLDGYIEFSRTWSPRSFDGYHEACGLWLLSTIAARRVKTEFGRARYPSLFLLLTGRSSLFAKTTAAGVAIDVIYKLNLAHLLTPDQSTPQKFLSLLTSRLPENYDSLNIAHKELIRKRLSLRGARGWFHDEFGGQIQAMMQPSGVMAEFRNILRKFDDCPDSFETASHARDLELIQAPYLALLGNLTPADLSRFAQKGSELWSDGFLARFAIICPQPQEPQKQGRFPRGRRMIPVEILAPLRAWDARLGKAAVQIAPALEKSRDDAGAGRVEVNPCEESAIAWPDEVDDAYYRYLDALGQITHELENPDFDASYVRLAEKALRISVLLASLNGQPAVDLRCWSRAQAITERWRAGLHALYEQVNQRKSNSRENEERVLKVIRRHGALTAAEVARYVRGLSTLEAKQVLDGLVETGLLLIHSLNSTQRYDLAEPGS